LLPYTQLNTIKHQYPNLGIVVHKNPSIQLVLKAEDTVSQKFHFYT
jgi:hypothetical protein